MYSVKPGRGPSMMGCLGGIVAAVFGVFWTVSASSAGAPPIFALFGVVFVIVAIVGALYSLYNATARNRFSNFDITTGREESDPIAEALDLGPERDEEPTPADVPPRRIEGDFCPYCGTRVDEEFAFCPKCGKDI